MKLTKRKLNFILPVKLPSAYLCGVRVRTLTDDFCTTTVKYRWINQNPFRSIYFAVLLMAAELSTAAILLRRVSQVAHKIPILVLETHVKFLKKAKGRVTFTCEDKGVIGQAVNQTITQRASQKLDLIAIGKNSNGEVICEVRFLWTMKKIQKG